MDLVQIHKLSSVLVSSIHSSAPWVPGWARLGQFCESASQCPKWSCGLAGTAQLPFVLCQAQAQMPPLRGLWGPAVSTSSSRKVPMFGLEAIWRNGQVVGHVRRADFGFTIDKTLAYGYIRDPSGRPVSPIPCRCQGVPQFLSRARTSTHALHLCVVGAGGWEHGWVTDRAVAPSRVGGCLCIAF